MLSAIPRRSYAQAQVTRLDSDVRFTRAEFKDEDPFLVAKGGIATFAHRLETTIDLT